MHNQNTHAPAPMRLIALREVQRLTSLGRTTIYNMIAAGAFPKQRAIPSSNRVAWVEAEVLAWVARVSNGNEGEALAA